MSNKYFDLLKPNIDAFGVITQNANNSWDGGDTAQREGMFALAVAIHYFHGRLTAAEYKEMIDRYRSVIDRLNDNAWSLKRHPDPSKWYSENDCMSRDQLTSNLVSIGIFQRDLLFKMLLKSMARAGIFTTNTRQNGAYPTDKPAMSTWQKLKFALGLYDPGIPCYYWKLPDLLDPSMWGGYIRGLNWKLLWPMLLMTDLVLVFGAFSIMYKVKKDPTFCDHLSYQMLILQSKYIMSTPVSKLAMWIYKKVGPQKALDLYFQPANCGPALNEVYREIWAD